MKMHSVEEIDITLRLIAYYKDLEREYAGEIKREAIEKKIFFQKRLEVLTSFVLSLEK